MGRKKIDGFHWVDVIDRVDRLDIGDELIDGSGSHLHVDHATRRDGLKGTADLGPQVRCDRARAIAQFDAPVWRPISPYGSRHEPYPVAPPHPLICAEAGDQRVVRCGAHQRSGLFLLGSRCLLSLDKVRHEGLRQVVAAGRSNSTAAQTPRRPGG